MQIWWCTFEATISDLQERGTHNFPLVFADGEQAQDRRYNFTLSNVDCLLTADFVGDRVYHMVNSVQPVSGVFAPFAMFQAHVVWPAYYTQEFTPGNPTSNPHSR
jgi:hypothetical protein